MNDISEMPTDRCSSPWNDLHLAEIVSRWSGSSPMDGAALRADLDQIVDATL